MASILPGQLARSKPNRYAVGMAQYQTPQHIADLFGITLDMAFVERFDRGCKHVCANMTAVVATKHEVVRLALVPAWQFNTEPMRAAYVKTERIQLIDGRVEVTKWTDTEPPYALWERMQTEAGDVPAVVRRGVPRGPADLRPERLYAGW